MEEQSSRRGVPGSAPLSRQREEYARLIARGMSNAEACRTVGVNRRTGTRWRYGRTIPARDGRQRHYLAMVNSSKDVPAPSPRYLSEHERAVIGDGLRAKDSMRAIARELGRNVSTVSRELGRNRDEQGRYRPSGAQRMATARLARPEGAESHPRPVAGRSRAGLVGPEVEPEQISATLAMAFPNDSTRHLSAESIYQALYAKETVLQRDPQACLRSRRRRRRRPHRRGDRRRANEPGGPGARRPLGERPAEVEDRTDTGHWEGDLITGHANRSAIATLVERATGYTVLVHLPGRTPLKSPPRR